MRNFFTGISIIMLITVLFSTPAFAMCGNGYSRTHHSTRYSSAIAPNVNYNYDIIDIPQDIDIEALIETKRAYLDDLVKAEIITQQYADIALDNYTEMLEFCADNGYFGNCIGFGRYGGFGNCAGYYRLQ